MGTRGFPSKGSGAGFADAGWYKHRLEHPLDEWSYKRNRHILESRIFPALVYRALEREVFATALQFVQANTPKKPAAVFEEVIKKFWIPFAKQCLFEVLTLGVIAIRISRMRKHTSAPYIPVVMDEMLGVDYDITVRKDPVDGLKRFTYYRKRDSNGDILSEPVVDKDVTVLFGFGVDPRSDGSLKCVASTLFEQEQYMWLNYRFSAQALSTMARPPIVTRTSQASEGMTAQDDLVDYYGTGDSARRREKDMYWKNSAEIAALKKQNAELFDRWGEDAENPMSGSAIKPHVKKNVFPLPADHVLEHQVNASHRSDMDAAIITYQKMVSAALGVPWEAVISGQAVKVLAGAKFATHNLEKTVNTARDLLSGILTDAYRTIYQAEDYKDALSKYTDDELQKMAPHKFQEKVQKATMTVVLRPVPTETVEDLLIGFGMGVKGWEEFSRKFNAVTGQEQGADVAQPPFEKDPWNQKAKIALFRTAGGPMLQKMGPLVEAVYGDGTETGKEKEKGAGGEGGGGGGNEGDRKRKRASGSGDDEAKKKKADGGAEKKGRAEKKEKAKEKA